MGKSLIIKGADFSASKIIVTQSIIVNNYVINDKTIDASGNVSDETGSAIIVVPVIGGYEMNIKAKTGTIIGQSNLVYFYTSESLNEVIKNKAINQIVEIPSNAKYIGYKIKGSGYDNTSKLEIIMPLGIEDNLVVGEPSVYDYFYDDSCVKQTSGKSTGVYISGIAYGIKVFVATAANIGTARIFTSEPSNPGATMIKKYSSGLVSGTGMDTLGHRTVYLQLSQSNSNVGFKSATNIVTI